MHQSKVPSIFWVEAFSHSVFLINNLPSSSLDFQSPNECLNKCHIDFNMLKFFGCLCYPNLRSYTKHKLEPRSLPCVFIGYSMKHKGFKCYHISSGKTYISRHVIFNERCFLYKDNIPCDVNLGELLEYNDWFGPNKKDIASKRLREEELTLREAQIKKQLLAKHILHDNDDSLYVTTLEF